MIRHFQYYERHQRISLADKALQNQHHQKEFGQMQEQQCCMRGQDE
jgi:hypothetical protein